MRSISIHPACLDTKTILKLATIACLLTIFTLNSILSAQAQTGTAHTVRTGESLSVIAQSYGVTASEVAAANGISNYDIVSGSTHWFNRTVL
ncbi:MAG: LysM peptidoglycan-binding domain-containing protein [Chloroflexota bacterium]